METKECNKCKQIKSLTREFWHKDKQNKDGFSTTCSKCRIESTTKWIKANTSHIKEVRKKRDFTYRQKHPKGNTCKKCGIFKSWNDYPEFSLFVCRSCKNKQIEDWGKRNPEKKLWSVRNSTLKIRYGITLEDFENLFKIQGSKCAICEIAEERDRFGWNVDHNHSTNTVRGVLCKTCNVGLGSFKDDIRRLLKAIIYLMEERKFENGELYKKDQGGPEKWKQLELLL